jgi:hypothetical protein
LAASFLPARLAVLLLAGLGACQKQKAPERRFYDEHIQPIFTGFCVGNTSPCHRIDEQTGVAQGNLDLSSFEAVQRRRDVLRNYGAYPQPLLLLKVLPEESVLIPYDGRLLASEIRHVGGKTLSPSSDAFFELKRWIDQGATRDGVGDPPAPRPGEGGCATTLPPGPPLPAVNRQSASYQLFVSDVAPLLRNTCAFGNCHSSPQADFFLTCGETDELLDANFARAASFVAPAPNRPDQSELLLRPLSPRAGGLSHTGGTFFSDRDDKNWKTLRAFAEAVQAEPLAQPERSRGEIFFGLHVMPVMLKRGCAFETCHSPNGFNDFRLRPGSVGFLSPIALHRNYEAALTEFMSLDTPDVRQSRLVKKNLFHPIENGSLITHRGGPLLEGAADSRAPCPPFDPATASALCTIAEWHRIERQDHAAVVSPLDPGSTVPVAFVARPADPDGPLEFDTFRGGAELRLADARLGAGGRVEQLANVRGGLGACSGLAGRSDLDIRGPEWSHDGERLVFAARAGEAGGLDLWLLEPNANRCRRLTSDNGRLEGSVRVHNFDAVFAPDGSLVFASTRRGLVTLKRLLPNADLYRVGPALDFTRVDTMTVLSGSEIAPAFMQNGQLSFTTEKASPDFYQLSGRRINWDLTDYHPLLAQRAQSDDTFGNMAPSVGYQQGTEIREALDRNFLLILSDTSARGGGGALAVFNRSIGPFEEGRREKEGKTFLPSMHLADPAATGRPGTAGVYRSPFPLPDGEILASFAANVGDPAAVVPRYDLVAVDPVSGARRELLAGGAASLVEAAVGYKRSSRLLFRNVPQLVFGGVGLGAGDQATVHFPDLPALATLLDANLRRGRNVAQFDAARYLAVYSVSPPPSATVDPSMFAGMERVFTQRQLIGAAPLERDGSVKVTLPAGKPLIFELQGGDRKPIFTMREEHQLGPGEVISPGVPRQLFNAVCAGCHGSISGKEPDVAVTPDALTGATRSMSRDQVARELQP